MFLNQLWFKVAISVTRNLNWQLTKLTFQRFATTAIAGVAGGIADGFMTAMTKVVFHLGLKRTFNDGFSQLFENSILTEQVLGFFIIFQQTINQVWG